MNTPGRLAPDENPAIVADLMGELQLPSGCLYEVGLGRQIQGAEPGSSLPDGPWRIIHLRLKGKRVWLRGYSSGFLFAVGHSSRPEAGSDLFPVLTREHVRKILEIVGMENGKVES